MIEPVGTLPTPSTSVAADPLQQTARDLESAFVREMLNHAGLADAFTGSGGPATDAFSGFLLEAVADQITDAGGFGLAERFYAQLSDREAGPSRSVRL